MKQIMFKTILKHKFQHVLQNKNEHKTKHKQIAFLKRNSKRKQIIVNHIFFKANQY